MTGPQVDPSEPTHEDYQLLVAIRDMTEARMQEAHERGEDYDLNAGASRYVDVASLSYYAMRHAAGMLGLTSSLEVNQHREEVMQAASIFVQGFLFGAQFQQTRTPVQRAERRRNARSGDPRKRAQT